MIVIGVDPGSRDTGIAVVDDRGLFGEVPALLASTTVHRADAGPIVAPSPEYLRDVNAAILELLRDRYSAVTAIDAVELIAIEGISAPGGFAKGKRHTLDPAPLIGTGIVLGAVLGRAWTVPVVTIRPGGNGHRLPLPEYPGILATSGKGKDKRRHERSAYDVACQGRMTHRLERARP